MTEDTDENPNFIRRYGLEGLVTPEEIDSMSGLKLLKTKFNTIFDKILQTTILEYFPLEGLPDNLKAKYEWINNNYKSIMPYANGMALKYLGVSIVSNEQVDVLDVSESVDMFISGEKRIDEREAYIVPSREKDHITGLSSDIRMALSLIHDYQYELTDEGYQVKTENIDGVEYELYKTSMEGIDIPHYMPIEEVTPILIRLFNTARDSKELTKMVIKAKNQVPWLGQLEDRLLYDPKFGTLLFQVIQKNATNYNRNTLDSRKTGIKVSEPLNTRNTSRQLSSYVQSKYISTSSRPAFVNSDNTLNRAALNKLKTEFSTIQKAVRGRQNTDEKVDKLLTLLANLGIDNLDFTEILYTDEGESTFKNIVSAIDRAKIFTKISEAAAKNGVVTYGEISSPMYAIIEAVTPLIKGNIELTQRDGGKTYSTFTDSSFLESMIASLSSNNNLFEDYFDKYRAFGKVVKGNREYISDFLTMLKNNTNNVKYYLKHYARTTVPSSRGESVSYLKQNRKMYLSSLITDYFAPSVVNFYSNVKNSDLALFRIPIMSDKQASDSILFSKKAKVVADSSSDIKFPEEGINAIADSAFKYFIYELDRMKYILNQLANGKAENDIKTFIPKRKAAETQALIQAYKSNTLSGKYFSNSVIRSSGLSFRYTDMFQPLLEDEKSNFGKAIIAYLNGKPLSIKNQDAFRDIWKSALDKEYQKFKAEINSLYGTKKTPGYIAIFNTIATTEYSKNKRLPKLSSAAAEAYLKEYFYNDYWATLNIVNLTSIDPAFYKNTIDFQKRNAQIHSATQRGDAKATFVSDDGYDDVSVSDGYHRILIIKDIVGNSPLAEVGGVLSKAFEKAATTETNPKRKKDLLELANNLPKFFKGYDVCDGQAYSSPTGFFKRMTMLGEDTYEFRQLLDKINKGDFNIDDIKKVSQQPYKPFTYGWSEKKVGDALMPTPMQVKDSESMLLIAGALLKQAKVEHPLRILFDFMEASMYNDLDAFFNSKSLEEYEKHLETTPHKLNSDTYNPAGLDTIAFDSAIKEGSSGVLDLNKASFEEIQNELKKTVKGNTWNDSYIHKVPAMAWGKQQEVPGHMQDHEQSFGSQAKVLSSTDIEDNETVVINGKEYTGKKVKEAYFKLLAKDLSDAVKSITKDITDDVIYSQDYINKLSKKIRASISRDAKFSSDLFNAFSVFDTMGNLIAPIKDPAYSDKALSTIFSEIRKKVNDQLMPGGPIVQQAPFGLDDTLNIVDSKGKSFREADFNPLDGGIVYETYITCPSSELEAKLTKKDGSLMTVDDAKKAGILTDKDLEFISYRIPTEDKYSIFRCKIKGFLSRRGGETIIMPADIVPMSGTDFDIDKMFTIFRCNDYMKLTHIPKESYKTKNEIFNYMWGMLGSKSATLNHLTPGNYEELKDMAKDIDLNRAGNPNIAYVTTQVQLQESNAAGKTFVGIAALNNTAHGINSQVGIAFKVPEFNFKIEGKSITDLIENINGENVVPFDTVYSKFDGNRISKTLCKFVGASADNAKETLLGSLNYSSTTATLAMGMLRFGIPLTTVTYMLNLPRVQELIKTAVLSEKSLTSVLNKAVDNIESKEKASEYNITYKELQQEIRKFNNSKLEGKEYKHNEKLTNAVLTFLYNFNDYAQNIQDVNILCGLNSTKNAVGPSGYETVIQEYKIKEAEALFEKGHIATKLEDYYKAVPHIKILRDIYADAEGKQRVVPSLTSRLAYPVSALYNNNFRSVLEKLENQFKVNIGRMNVATLKHLFNSFLVYQAGKKKVIDVNKVSDIIYGTPLALINNRDKFEKNRLLSDMYIRNNPSRYNGTYEINLNSKVPSEVKDLQSASWANLISKRENREFSNILMTYNILKFGFDWNPKSALNVAPVTARLAIPGYKNIFEDTMNDMWEATDFIVEYAANNPTSDIVRDVTKVANDEEVQDLTTYSAQEFVDNARNPMSIESKLLAKIDSPIIGGFDDGNIIIKVNENELYVVEAKGGNGMFYEYNVDKSIVDTSMAKKQKNSLSDLATINESNDSNTDETETTEYTRKEDEDISEVLDTIDTALDSRQTITNLQKIAQSLESIKDDASGIFLPKYNEVVDKAISKLTNLNTKKADIKKQVLTNLNSLCR